MKGEDGKGRGVKGEDGKGRGSGGEKRGRGEE